MSISLADMRAGQTALVAKVAIKGAAGRRLGELGILPGARVKALGRAPLGDPIAIEARGGRIAIGMDAAARVYVEGDI